MKLDRINEYVLATTVVVVGVVLAVVCGRLAGTGDGFWLYLGVAATIYLITCLWLRTNIWLLIPMFWSVTGELNSVTGHPPFRDVIVAGVVLYFFTLMAFKAIRNRPVYSWIDLILWINILYVVILYIRYPIGLNSLGSDVVGGRVYAEVVVAAAAYWVLNHIIMSPRQARLILPVLLCIVSFFLTLLTTITFLIPSTAPILGKLYGGVDSDTYNLEQSGADIDISEVRAGYLAGVGTNVINLLTSYVSPLTLINPLYIWRCLLTGIAFYFCLKSGHRITIPAIAFTFFLATFFRKGFAATIILGLITIPPMVLLIAGQGHLYELPRSAQRTLCMFPWGDWDPDVKQEAQGSTDWRIQMWRIMLTDQRYIHDKVFGDGFGFSREEMMSMAATSSQEGFMEINAPHSGPVSTIRAGGVVGLAFFLLLLFALARRSWRLIRRAKGTPFYPLSLYLGIQLIYKPFAFVVIFGDYKDDLPNMVMFTGLLNVLTNGLNAYLKSIEAPLPPPILKKTVQALAPIPAPALH